MRLIFLGSGEFGLPTLRLLHATHELAAVVTQPDRPAGRHRHLTPTPVGHWAVQENVPLFKTDNANDPALIAELAGKRADAAVVIAFGQKLSPQLIAALGPLTVNLHASLLPKYRGAAPINWAIIRGETVTGVSVIGLAQRMDAGLIYATDATPIAPLETAGELHDRLAALGPAVISQVLGQHAAGTLDGQVQDDSLATKAPKLSKQDARIHFDEPADAVRCRIHGLTPWPGVQVTWRRADGREQPLLLRRVQSVAAAPGTAPGTGPGIAPGIAPGTLLDAGCVAVRDGAIRLLEVQSPGGRVLSFEDFCHGHPMQAGEMLIG